MATYTHYYIQDINPSLLQEEMAAAVGLPDHRFELRGFEAVTRVKSEPQDRVITRSHGNPTDEALAGEYSVHTEETMTRAEVDVVDAVFSAHNPGETSTSQSNNLKAAEYVAFIEENIDSTGMEELVNYKAAWLAAWRGGGFA